MLEVLRGIFLNILLRNEEYLLTQNKRIFETVSIFVKALAFRLTVQKWPEARLERPVYFE